MSSNVIPWNDVIKREARGINNEDFGDMQIDYYSFKQGLL